MGFSIWGSRVQGLVDLELGLHDLVLQVVRRFFFLPAYLDLPIKPQVAMFAKPSSFMHPAQRPLILQPKTIDP